MSTRFDRFYTRISSTYFWGKTFSVPSSFRSYFVGNGVNASDYNTFYICRASGDYILYLSADTSNPTTMNHIRPFYVLSDYSYFFDDITLSQENAPDVVNVRSLIEYNCFKALNSDFSYSSNNNYFTTINKNNTDDFLNSKEPIQYLPYLLYFSLPIILFVLAIKTFRRGLFR